MEPWVFARVGQLWLCGGGEGSKMGQCFCWLTSRGLPGIRPIASYFIHFPYATGTPPAAVLVMGPRMGGFLYILGCPGKPAVSSATLTPTGFTAGSYEAFFFPVLETWAVHSGLGLGSLAQKLSPWFLSTTRECGAAHFPWPLPPPLRFSAPSSLLPH